ncbi:hypothetical protein DPMN_074099 [Dreissena polymorpha]|uniref:Uncharacterized protein n=1 Tax=Dreissena polymorpha TaxID=45954 RepID=A0A9D3YH12_DREPO|nr:hypothetical protein DPMN_074099 [Dreissena polymorpha]
MGVACRTQLLTGKNATPPDCHVVQHTRTIFELFQDIIRKKCSDKVLICHTRKNAPPPGGHVFQQTRIIFKLVKDNISKNLLNKFHEDWTIKMASTVENASPLAAIFFSRPKTFSKQGLFVKHACPPYGLSVVVAAIV